MVYNDNLKAAHSRIHALEIENKNLKTKKQPEPPKEKKVKCNNCGGWFHRIGGAVTAVVIGLLVLAGAAAAAYPLYMSIFESEAGDCYVEYDTNSNRHMLYQTVTWDSDRTMGEYKTVQEAIDEAKVVGCSLEKKLLE
jgi:hypothetical protein